MAKEHTTPLVLWICAAVCAHYIFAKGGNEVAETHEGKSAVSMLGSQARERARIAQTQSFDVLVSSDDKSGPEVDPKKDEPEAKKDEPKPTQKDQAKVEPPPPVAPPPPKKEEEKPKLKLVVKEEDPLKKLDAPPPPPPDKRIAVRQHVQKDQEDNPNAKFIGDEANHVQEESVATQTSHDQDDPNPTPGGNHQGPRDAVGDSSRTKIADSDEHKGEKNRAPGERGTEFDVQPDPMPTKPTAPVAVQGPAAAQAPKSGGDGKPVQAAQTAPPKTDPVMAPGAPLPAAPEVVQGTSGSWSFNPIRPNPGTGTAPDPAQGNASQKVQTPQGTTKWLGLGGQPGPGQVNINLSHQGVVAAVGADQLKKERVAEGERRKSEHRGSWQASNFERWRSAIENYVSTVKPGNQTALNTARVPFATYIVNIHNRIHPLFADSFLDSLDSLPKTHPLNQPAIYTSLEIVLSKEGRLVKMGVVRTSGVTAFDIAALDSVSRASPFGPAPNAILSPDGNVYLHWEFHRNRDMACTTFNAYPYILNVPAPQQQPEPPPGDPKGPPTRERGAPPPANLHETREGKNDKNELGPALLRVPG